MKKLICGLAALLAAAPLAFAEAKASAEETPVPPPLSRFSVGVHLSYWDARDLDDLDLDGAIGGGVIGQVRLLDFLSLEMRAGIYGAGQIRDIYVEGEGWYETETTLTVMPLEAGLIAFLPLGDTFSLYGGPGAGYYVFDGEFTSDQGPWETTYNMDLEDEAGFYAVLGGRIQLARNAAVFAEAKYTWVETSFERDAAARQELEDIGLSVDGPDIDFSGIAFQAGMIFTF